MIWCVRTDAAGSFRGASRPNRMEPDRHEVVFSFDEWRRTDPKAAAQFTAPPAADVHHRAQLAFISATGLDQSARLQSSMRQAHYQYGGLYVTTSSSSRPR